MSKALIYEAITSFYLPVWIAGAVYYFESDRYPLNWETWNLISITSLSFCYQYLGNFLPKGHETQRVRECLNSWMYVVEKAITNLSIICPTICHIVSEVSVAFKLRRIVSAKHRETSHHFMLEERIGI